MFRVVVASIPSGWACSRADGWLDMNLSEDVRSVAERLIRAGTPNYYRVLDLGCGLAPLLSDLKDLAGDNPFFYQGIDQSSTVAREAAARFGVGDGAMTFSAGDLLELCSEEQLPWYNVVIARDLVEHLGEAEGLCELISRVLVNDGVFYMRTPLVRDSAEGSSEGFTKEHFCSSVVRRFERQTLFDLHLFESETDGKRHINLLGHKRSITQFDRHHYAFGYDRGLSGLKALITPYVDQVNHFGDEHRTIRHEGYLASMTDQDFGTVMDCLQRAVDRIRPGKRACYMKDKLNVQHTGMRFRLHQDATANWNDIIGPFEFVTFGVPLEPVVDASYGGTRLVYEQGHSTSLLDCSSTSAIDPEAYSASVGRPTRYLNCLATPGTYYAYDQYVLHDSSENQRSDSRSVLFISCILTDDADIYSRSFSRHFEPLLETRPGLDIKRHSGRRAQI